MRDPGIIDDGFWGESEPGYDSVSECGPDEYLYEAMNKDD